MPSKLKKLRKVEKTQMIRFFSAKPNRKRQASPTHNNRYNSTSDTSTKPLIRPSSQKYILLKESAPQVNLRHNLTSAG